MGITGVVLRTCAKWKTNTTIAKTNSTITITIQGTFSDFPALSSLAACFSQRFPVNSCPHRQKRFLLPCTQYPILRHDPSSVSHRGNAAVSVVVIVVTALVEFVPKDFGKEKITSKLVMDNRANILTQCFSERS
eukprot:m.344423 g.344423  ORF g.344423 m.344423 type:complete len:134 (-) comp24450_c0_seq1:87-488(-)